MKNLQWDTPKLVHLTLDRAHGYCENGQRAGIEAVTCASQGSTPSGLDQAICTDGAAAFNGAECVTGTIVEY